MNKQELIHVHGLLAEVHRWYEEHEQPINCRSYRDHGVWPTTIPAPKADHEQAIQLLALALVSGIEAESTEGVVAEAA